MSLELKLGTAAVILEAAAITLLFLHSNDSSLLYGYLLLHALACGFMTPMAWRLMPLRYREPRLQVMGLLFGLCFFIPVLGLLGFFFAALVTTWLPFFQRGSDFLSVTTPIYQPAKKAQETRFRAGRVREQLVNRDSPLDLRMKALLAIQHMPARHSSDVLREALGDSTDDLRLLAYGMLESKEKQLTQRIQEAQKRLRRYRESVQPEEYATAARELAELYWELVYQNLVQGDMRHYALEQVQRYSAEALKWHVRDAGLWVISGRMRMLGGDYEGAAAAFSAAIALGFPPVRAEPYLAELAFLKRDYASVRRLMRRIRAEGRMPQLRQAASYWN